MDLGISSDILSDLSGILPGISSDILAASSIWHVNQHSIWKGMCSGTCVPRLRWRSLRCVGQTEPALAVMSRCGGSSKQGGGGLRKTWHLG